MVQFDQQTQGAHLKNPKVKAAYSPAKTYEERDEKDQKQFNLQSAHSRRRAFTKITDMVAGDEFCTMNQSVGKWKEFFPTEWRMQFAEIFYPFAKGGELYIDMPKTTYDTERCKRKMEVLQKQGYRYVWIGPHDSAQDALARLEGGK